MLRFCGADGVPHDQHDVASILGRGRQPPPRAIFTDRLPPRGDDSQDGQHAEERRDHESPPTRGRPRAVIALPTTRPNPAARTRLYLPSSGNLSRADQTASVANNHDCVRSETGTGRNCETRTIKAPGTSMRAAWPSGTVQGKSAAFRKCASMLKQNFLRTVNPTSRYPPQRPNETARSMVVVAAAVVRRRCGAGPRLRITLRASAPVP